jgi:hypothetical protein
MKWKAGLTAVALAFLFAATPASPQEYRSEVTVFTGASFLDAATDSTFDYNERFEQSFVVGVRYGFVLSPHFTIEGSYRYSPNGTRTVKWEDSLFPSDLIAPFDEPSHAVGGGLVYYLSTSEKLRPFVVGGLGAEIFRHADTFLRGEAGFGFRWLAREGLALRVDAKYVVLRDFYVTGNNEGAAEIQLGLVVGL